MAFVAVMTNKAVNCQRVLVVNHESETHERVGEAVARPVSNPRRPKARGQ